jgi:hypothetical protein
MDTAPRLLGGHVVEAGTVPATVTGTAWPANETGSWRRLFLNAQQRVAD